jgi:hypothetical protein
MICIRMWLRSSLCVGLHKPSFLVFYRVLSPDSDVVPFSVLFNIRSLNTTISDIYLIFSADDIYWMGGNLACAKIHAALSAKFCLGPLHTVFRHVIVKSSIYHQHDSFEPVQAALIANYTYKNASKAINYRCCAGFLL